MSDQLLVSFVTVNTKTPHFMRQLLGLFTAARVDFPYEYFVVDNGSDDESVALIRERFPWVRVIENGTNLGFGPANNRAMRLARGRYVALVNPDLMVFPGEFERWVAWMEAHPDVGVSGPKLVYPDRTPQASFCRFHHVLTPLYRRTFLGQLPWGKRALARYFAADLDREQEQDVDWLLGAALLIRRDVLERIEYFDERFFLYFEDEDLCRRIWEAGYRVTYAPVASFVHFYQRESQVRHLWQALTNRKTRLHIASGVKYFWKYRRRPPPRA